MNSATQDRISATALWQKCWQTTTGTFPKSMYISLFTIILPEMLFEFFYAERAQQYVEKVHEFTTARLNGGGVVDFFDLVDIAGQYFTGYFLVGFALCLVYLSAYFALVQQATEFCLGKPLSKTFVALKYGMQYALPTGFVALSAFAVMVLFAQVILPPLEIILIPGLMIPVLIVAAKQKAFPALKQSLLVSYGKNFPQGAIALMFHLISLGAFFIASLLVVVYASYVLHDLDILLGIRRDIWLVTVPNSSITWVAVFGLTMKTLGITLIVQLLASFSTALYFWVQALHLGLPRGGITA